MDDKRTWLYVAFGSAALLLSACAVWRLAGNDDCPLRSLGKREVRLQQTAFHGQVPWEGTQEERERSARTWMERYVKSAILNRAKKHLHEGHLEAVLAGRRRGASMGQSDGEAGRQDNSVDDQAGSGSAADLTAGMDLSNMQASNEGESGGGRTQGGLVRQSSLIQVGTGRYEQHPDELRSCIATEKGLLTQADFEHIQKVIEVYSKALLCEVRQKHRQERLASFTGQDWEKYASMVLGQQAKEIKLFNRATLEVLAVADIKTPVFNQSVELHMITSQDSLLQSAKLSLYTPFSVSQEHARITSEKARLMLTEAAEAALILVQTPELLSVVGHESDLLLFFDSLMTDYVYTELKMDADQFRAVLFKYSLQDESERSHSVAVLEDVCNQLYKIQKNQVARA